MIGIKELRFATRAPRRGQPETLEINACLTIRRSPRKHTTLLMASIALAGIAVVLAVCQMFAPQPHFCIGIRRSRKPAALVVLLVANFVVTCPSCRLRLVQHAIGSQPASNWFRGG